MSGSVAATGHGTRIAWCSIWIPDHGWLDFDPTNGIVAPSRHVTIGWGRDYADVAPVRGVVVGRKNHYGSRSKRGTEVAALFYTLFESAKLSGVEPKAYVLKAALAAIRKPGTITLPQDLLDSNPK